MYEPEPEPAWAQRMANRPQNDDTSNTVESLSSGRSESTRQLEQSPLLRQSASVHQDESSALSWLSGPRLPSKDRIRTLLDHYFASVHPLRCFAFIHKPTFLRRLDYENSVDQSRHALLHIMCAMGAQFYCLERREEYQLPPKSILNAGNAWAKTAQGIVLGAIDDITIENLMAAILLHDYAIRMGNFPSAFMLCGVATRMSQALQINLEYSTDILCENPEGSPSASAKESRRRLMWSCYITDTFVGSGVDQLTLLDERAINLQLPCNERSFLQQIPCITETLTPGKVLSFIPPDRVPVNPLDNMGIASYFLRHVQTRKRVLKYIKHLDKAKLPWLHDSEFRQLDAECRNWHDNLPASLQWTDTAIYIRKESSQLGALCSLHCAYHQTMCDLYRLGVPALYKLRAAFQFPPEQKDFLKHLQWTLFGHAKSLATIMTETASHGAHMLADSWLPTILYDSCRILLYHLTQIIDPTSADSKALMLETVPFLRQTVRGLQTMRSLYTVADPLHKTAETMLKKAGLGVGSEPVLLRDDIIPDDPYPTEHPNANQMAVDHTDADAQGTLTQSAPDYVLNPLSIYRLARRAIPEKHAPDRATGTSSNPATSARAASDANPSPLPTPQQEAPPGRALPTTETDTSLDELRDFFTSDLGWNWQPAETAVDSGAVVANGMLPWAADLSRATGFTMHAEHHQSLDAWEPPEDFSFQQ
jgi:hypothetical protein